MYAVLLKPMPIREPGSLVIGWGTSAALNMRVIELSYLDVQDIGEATPAIGTVASVGSSALDRRARRRRRAGQGADHRRVRAPSSSCSAPCRCCGRMIRPDDDRTEERAR